MSRPPHPQLLGFLERYDPVVADLVLGVRDVVLEEAPDAQEVAYGPHLLEIWYGCGEKDWFCYIQAHTRHVNLGFPFGATLADPQRRLAGSGKTNRHISITRPEDVDTAVVRGFLQRAIDQAGSAGRGSGESVIKVRKARK